MERNKREKGEGLHSILTQEQSNEFQLNYLGYYCKVREKWEYNNIIKKNDRKGFQFDIVRCNEKGQEVIVQKGVKLFSVSEKVAIDIRNSVIDYYLKKVEK